MDEEKIETVVIESSNFDEATLLFEGEVVNDCVSAPTSECCVARQISLAQPFTAGLAMDVMDRSPINGAFCEQRLSTQA